MGSCRNSNSAKLLGLSLLPVKIKKIHPKMKAIEWSQHFSHYKYMGIFPDTQGQLIPQPEVRSGWILNPSKLLWLSLLHAKMKKINQKMKALEWSQRFSHHNSMWIFPNAQGQLTQALVLSCWTSNTLENLCLSSLPARIKKNKSKMKKLEWSQDFLHYNPMEAIRCHGNQSSDPIWPKTLCSQSPPCIVAQDEIWLL